MKKTQNFDDITYQAFKMWQLDHLKKTGKEISFTEFNNTSLKQDKRLIPFLKQLKKALDK